MSTSDFQQISVPTMDRSGQRRWLYPDRRQGKYTSRRKWTALLLISVYLILPWIRWNDMPVLRFDVLEKRAYVFGQILHLTDAAMIAPILVAAAFFLFFATSLKGRVWCAYACPQTVFVEWVIRPIEELIEGPAHRRKRMDSGKITFALLTRKVIKHVLFICVAAIVANTFLSFFFGPERVALWMSQSPVERLPQFGVMMFVLVVFYLDLAWFREQFCAYLCPYARFQSVIMDQNTPVVTYDLKRGEPHSSTRNRKDSKSAGDCIDCQLCVRVCPTGIDIRNGHQLECIMCARCIDACNVIMSNLSRPSHLIKIASQNATQDIAHAPAYRRPKVIAYGLLFVVVSAGIYLRMAIRERVNITVIRAPGSTYTQMPNNRMGNVFIFRVINNSSSPMNLDIKIIEPKTAEILCAQCATQLSAGSEMRLSAIVNFEPRDANQSFKIRNVPTGDEAQGILIGPNVERSRH